MVDIRAAGPADAEALARCQIACWRETYGPLVDPDRLASLTDNEAERIERWRSNIGDGLATLRLADDNGEIVGFAARGPSRDLDVDLDQQLYAIYTRQAYWSTGLGHRLIEAALGEHNAVLWVLGSNERAQRFYAAHGFVADGTEMEEPHFGLPEIRMVRRRG